MAKVTVSKINIVIDEKEIELTLEQAKELRDILNETLEKKIIITQPQIVHVPTWYPYTYPTAPHWTISSGSSGAYTITSTLAE